MPVLPSSTAAGLPALARALVQARRLSLLQASELQARAARNECAFIDALLASKLITPGELARFCADTYGYALFDLAQLELETLPAIAFELGLTQGERVLPVAQHGKRLAVALSDPTNQAALDRIRLQNAVTVEPVIVAHDVLLSVLERLARNSSARLDDLARDAAGASPSVQETQVTQVTMASQVEAAPLVRYLNQILQDAVRLNASDIHFEPYERSYRIRLRIDGVLHEHAAPPLALREQLVARLKVLARLDIAERRLPQDGRMRLDLGGSTQIDFRVSTLPTLFGEKTVVRLLDAAGARRDIDALGVDARQKAALLSAIKRPSGMVLVTGPTGSGKTVTLYSCLHRLNESGRNILTAEDPAEIHLEGINQVNINERAGLTFAAALRAFLRQDPDIVMVGEMRDLETASIAIKAAQTGHLVLSTLHTIDAPSTLTRLMLMGVAPFSLASCVTLITAQRLVRRLCHCKRPVALDTAVLRAAGFTMMELDGSWQPFAAVGCEQCLGSGYRGRVGIHQVMPISDATSALILAQADTRQIARQAALEGVASLRQSGLSKVRDGVTSLDEVLAVTDEA